MGDEISIKNLKRKKELLMKVENGGELSKSEWKFLKREQEKKAKPADDDEAKNKEMNEAFGDISNLASKERKKKKKSKKKRSKKRRHDSSDSSDSSDSDSDDSEIEKKKKKKRRRRRSKKDRDPSDAKNSSKKPYDKNYIPGESSK